MQYHGRTVIDDSNFQTVLPPPPGLSTGRLPRDWNKHPYGQTPYAAPFNLPLIPRGEWKQRIEEKEAKQTTIRHFCERAKLTVLDQNGTNYCWINAPTFAMMVTRLMMGLPTVRLSPASVGAKIKNFRNNGGWGTEGLEYIAEHGLVPQDQWPPNAINRQYDNAASDAERPKYRCLEWWDLKPGNFDQVATCVLLNIPVAIGLNWWSHEVTAVGIKSDGNRYLLEIANSWGTGYEENGYGLLSESKGTPDDAVAPRVATPSG